jgi:hypothetical protein
MLFSLDVIRARKGDCLILHFGSVDKPLHMIIDGGPSDVFKPHLRPRLDAIRAARKIPANQPLPIEVVAVSHIDDDHIRGILDLTRELRDAKGIKPSLVRVAKLWHNSFDKLVNSAPGTLTRTTQFGAAALDGTMDIPAGGDFDAAKVLASIPQGNQLRDDARLFDWRINSNFKGAPIMATDKPRTISPGGEVEMLVIGPMKKELDDLRKAHRKALGALQDDEKDERALAAYVDKSVTNLSSIVLLAKVGGKSMLLTGDASGDKVLVGLELAKAVAKGGKLHVDILKAPHHGSSNNVAQDFFERITADHYVFSGNGEHGNPERKTIEMLLAARAGADFTMHFTYPLAEIDVGRKDEWEQQQKKERQRAKKKPESKVRPDWSPEVNGLVELFAARGLPNQKQRIECMDGTEPHVLDLLDKSRFDA